MSVVRADLHLEFLGETVHATLDAHGWRSDGPEELTETLDIIASPADFGPADGDRLAAAASKAARLFRGELETTTVPDGPPGTIY